VCYGGVFMFLRMLYDRLDKDLKQNFVGGLVGGLVCGLVGGLVCGLVGGLVFGLVGGLVFGLVSGLVVGVFNNVFQVLHIGTIGWIIIIFLIFLLSELMFFLSVKYNKNVKYEKGVSLWYVLFRKLEEIFEIVLILVIILDVIWFIDTYFKLIIWKDVLNILFLLFGFVGMIFIVILIIVWWLKQNKKILITKKNEFYKANSNKIKYGNTKRLRRNIKKG
jgi:hypothetical protein